MTPCRGYCAQLCSIHSSSSGSVIPLRFSRPYINSQDSTQIHLPIQFQWLSCNVALTPHVPYDHSALCRPGENINQDFMEAQNNRTAILQ
jgi:hypothetical protein